MQKNEVNFKALTFISEQTASTFNYEVKGVRALWDPSLSIPGTNRRGGWRCPVGTRYGGQITDRFGRSCGWGVARRIANEIADIGERLENIDDRKRNNRLAKRNARMQRFLARQQKPGLLERGARNIAEALDGEQKPRQIKPSSRPKSPTTISPKPNAPKRKKAPRRRGNLRDSEARRMERELVEPGAPRTGEPPKPNKQRRRRRTAAQQGAKRTARRKPEADFVDGDKPKPTKVPTRKLPSAPRPVVVEADSDFAGDTPSAVDIGSSLPDERSIRNVRNRFRERGLPDNAYWREADFPEGEEKRELERRFGRYYDNDGYLNNRGDYVNRKIKNPDNKPGQPPKAPKAQADKKMPDLGGGGWDAINQPDGSTKWKKRNWTIELISDENGNFRGLKAKSSDDGVPGVKQDYNGSQSQDAMNRFLRDFEIGLREFEMDNENTSSPKPPTPATPPSPPTPPNPEPLDSLPASRVVPDADAGKGGRTPRRYGKEADLQRAVKLLHEDNGNLADVPDGVVIEAVFDGQFKQLNANGRPLLFTDAKIAEKLDQGFDEGEGSQFENRRYKFKLIADKNWAAPGPWQVFRVTDKINGEVWYLKTSTYGRNDALLENVGMRVAQDLEFGNNENHLRVGSVSGQPPKRWMMMRDVAQWENGVQGQWRDANTMTQSQAKQINPRDSARILALDFVFGNTDRHGGNFLMTEQGGRVRLAIIDNGMLFGGRVPNPNYDEREFDAWVRLAADSVVGDPSLRAYRNEMANNPFDELESLGYEFQNDRDRNIYKKTMRRSFERIRERLDEQLSIERIEANGIKLSDSEKNHLVQLRRVAEARIAWGLANLDQMTGNF